MKKDIYFSEKEFITLDRLRKGLHVEKKDNYFSEKEFDFRPAMLATMRKGLQVVKTDNYLSKKGFDFRTATLVTVRKGLYEKESILWKRTITLAKRSLIFVLPR